MVIKRQSKWQYVGSDEGFGLVHTVIQILGTHITTWSDADQGNEDEPGFTWAGLKADFVRDFQPVGGVQEA
jgi:hypothetical protein